MDRNSPEYRRYQLYLLSPEWQAKRQKKLRQVGRKCQYCGRSKRQGVRLQVHHLNYDRLGNEKMSDLAIACEDCHKTADKVREMETGRATFMAKKHGGDWESRFTVLEATQEFKEWLLSKS